MACCSGSPLSAADLSGINPLGGGCHKPHHKDTRTYTGPGKHSWRTQNRKTLLLHRTQERSSDPRSLSPVLLMSEVSSEGVGWQWPPAGSGALRAAVSAWDQFEGGDVLYIYLILLH